MSSASCALTETQAALLIICEIEAKHSGCKGKRKCKYCKPETEWACNGFGDKGQKVCVKCPTCRKKQNEKDTARRNKHKAACKASGMCEETEPHECMKDRDCSCEVPSPCRLFGTTQGRVMLTCPSCIVEKDAWRLKNETEPRLAALAAAREQDMLELSIVRLPEELQRLVDTMMWSSFIRSLHGTKASVYTLATLDVEPHFTFDEAHDAALEEAWRALQRPDCLVRFWNEGKACHITRAELRRVGDVRLAAIGGLASQLSGSSAVFSLEGWFMLCLEEAGSDLGHGARVVQFNKSDTARGVEPYDRYGDLIRRRVPTMWWYVVLDGWCEAGWFHVDNKGNDRLRPEQFESDPIFFRRPALATVTAAPSARPATQCAPATIRAKSCMRATRPVLARTKPPRSSASYPRGPPPSSASANSHSPAALRSCGAIRWCGSVSTRSLAHACAASMRQETSSRRSI